MKGVLFSSACGHWHTQAAGYFKPFFSNMRRVEGSATGVPALVELKLRPANDVGLHCL